MVRKTKSSKELRCVHRHTIKTHPTCFAKGRVKDQNIVVTKSGKPPKLPWYQEPGTRIGYIDIECDNLNANFGNMLSWAIKEKGGPVTSAVVTRREILNYTFDKNIVEKLIKEMKKYNVLVTYYGCLTPGHRVLKSDLTWENVENIVPGEELLAFDEEPEEGYRTRRFKTSKVINNIPIEKEVFEIELEDGQVLTATGDHPWLVQLGLGSKDTGYWVWRTTEQLKESLGYKNRTVSLTKMLNTWDKDDSFEAGYLSGCFDSDGCVSFSSRTERVNDTEVLSVSFSQNNLIHGSIVDKVEECLDKCNTKYSSSYYDQENKNQLSIYIKGGLANKLEFLGRMGIVKQDNLDFNKLGRITNIGRINIKSIKSTGIKTVCGLETSSKTYISEGFGSHNTGFDIKYIRTKALKYGFDFPEYGTIFHWDLYYTVRAKLKLHRNSLDVATNYLGIAGKTHIDWEVWGRAKFGDKVALAEVLEHNVYDVAILEKLHEKLYPFRKWIRTSL